MKKKSEKVLKTQPEVERAVKALKMAQDKREKRYANTRVVYAYVSPLSRTCTDNLILLPADTVDAHEEYLRIALSSVMKDFVDEKCEAVKNLSIERIGTFRVDSFEFKKLPRPIKLFTFGDVIKGMKK